MIKATAKPYYEEIPPEKSGSPTIRDLDTQVRNLIIEAGLTKDKNSFFKEAKKIKRIDTYSAMIIAANWREITKTFMFTTLIGIGHFAEKIGSSSSPHENLLKVLQTSIAVISDDLNNVFHIFKEQAPTGPEGIHYIWWENTILNPLRKACNTTSTNTGLTLPLTKKLTEGMTQLSKNPLGFAVQLRIVEAIALDIVLAFRPLFFAVEVKGKKLFTDRRDLNWIYSHITAEVVHHQQVKDLGSGMMIVAQTPADQNEILKIAKWYIGLWSGVFDEFVRILQPCTKNPDSRPFLV
jgi:hypothetical protein